MRGDMPHVGITLQLVCVIGGKLQGAILMVRHAANDPMGETSRAPVHLYIPYPRAFLVGNETIQTFRFRVTVFNVRPGT